TSSRHSIRAVISRPRARHGVQAFPGVDFDQDLKHLTGQRVIPVLEQIPWFRTSTPCCLRYTQSRHGLPLQLPQRLEYRTLGFCQFDGLHLNLGYSHPTTIQRKGAESRRSWIRGLHRLHYTHRRLWLNGSDTSTIQSKPFLEPEPLNAIPK